MSDLLEYFDFLAKHDREKNKRSHQLSENEKLQAEVMSAYTRFIDGFKDQLKAK